MSNSRSHAAAALEFAIPLGFALISLKVLTNNLGSYGAGLLIVFVTIGTFAISLDAMGGRALSGYISRLPPELGPSFVSQGLPIALVVSTAVAFGAFVGCALVGRHVEIYSRADVLCAQIIISLSALLAQLSNFILWSRLGMGQATNRSFIVIGSNLMAILTTLALLCLNATSLWSFTIPYILRDASAAAACLVWFAGLPKARAEPGLWRHFGRYALSGLAINLTSALFEPLTKLIFAKFAGLQAVPAFDLSLRAFTSVRNGLVIFVQTYTRTLATFEGNSPLIHSLEALCFCLGALALSLGGWAMHFVGPKIVSTDPAHLLALYIPLCTPIALHVTLIPRYIAMYSKGMVNRVLVIHIVQAVPPILLAVSGFNANLENVINTISFSYIGGAAITALLTKAHGWIFGSWITSGLLAGSILLAGFASMDDAAHSPQLYISITPLICLCSLALAVRSYMRLLKLRQG